MTDLKDASAVDVADLALAAATLGRAAALSIEPHEAGHTLSMLGGARPVSVVLPPGLGEAVVVRLALLAKLDPWATAPGLGCLRVRADAAHLDFLVELEGAPGVRRLRLRSVVALPAAAGGEMVPGAQLRTELGVYDLVAELGRGGMGVVYRATHRESGRAVAVKVLHAELARDGRLGTQLGREGRAASLANHPGIVSVTDFGSSPTGRAFLVMELVEAATLEDALAAGALPLRRALTIARRIASALEAAHVRGVIHHDLKPSNVFVDATDHVKIGDFGAAHVLGPSPGAEVTATQTGVILGTPRYMAPERVRGQQADERSDLYSLGCMLFQMVSGEAPFAGDTVMDVIAGHVARPVPRLKSPYGTVPELVSAVVRRAMAKSVEERYQNAGEMDVDLNRALLALPAETAP